MAESFLPNIINKIGDYRNSRLLQPLMRVKRVGLSRKHDWIKASALNKLSIHHPEEVVKFSPRMQPKKTKISRQRCYTEEEEARISELLIERIKKSSEKKSKLKVNELFLNR